MKVITKLMMMALMSVCPVVWGEGLAVNAVLVEVPSGKVAKALMSHVPGAAADQALWGRVEALVKSGEGKFVATMRAVVVDGPPGAAGKAALPVFYREVYSTPVQVPVGVPTLVGSVMPAAGVMQLRLSQQVELRSGDIALVHVGDAKGVAGRVDYVFVTGEVR